MQLKYLLALGAASVSLAGAIATPVAAQETTSTIRGSVTSGGAGVADAQVTVTHVPTGTVSTVTTDASGGFTATGLRVGGPYKVEVTAPGYPVATVTDINTAVGQTFSLPIELESQGETIVVTASRIKGAGNISQGPATVLNADQISKIASVNRDIRDLMRRDPFATLDTSQSTGRQVTFAGQNPRFNRFTIDGVPITDSFGLNPDALPSRRGPVPLDAIGQFETKVAPYDIREGFFQGGVVNAILKSGSNEFHGTAFYTYSADELVGKRTKPYLSNTTGRIAQPNFKSEDYGVQISGPIIKDKLFFMIAAERVRAAAPITQGTTENNAGNPVVGLSDAVLQNVLDAYNSRYSSYDPGGVLKTNGDKDDRVVAKLDANLSDTQRLAVTGIYTKDSLIVPTTTSNSSLGLESNAYTKPNKVYAGIVQLNSEWSSEFSTEARALYKKYESGQIPLMGRAAQFSVCAAPTSDRNTGGATTTNVSITCPNGTPVVLIGPGGPSQSNILDVETYGGSLLGRLTMNDHNLRILAEYTHTKTFNLFVNPSAGTYYFDSLADLRAGNAQNFSYNNAPSLDPNDAAAKFSYDTYTFGIQDSWRVNSMLNIAYGMRYDLFGGHSRPALNPAFVARQGFGNNAYISGRGLFQPRIGFDFTPTPRLVFRGGGGIFGGGSPDVYIGNSFSNTGVLNTSVSARVTDGGVYQLNGVGTPANAAIASAILNGVNITTISNAANTALQAAAANLSSPTATTTINALDPHFKLPSQWRATLSATYRANFGSLGDNWVFGVDGFYSKVRDQVIVTDLRSVPIVGTGALTPDGRQRYRGLISNADTNGDYLLTNTSKGRSWVGVVRFNKDWDFGLSLGGSFTYQDVKDASALTSSIASSIYNNGAYYDPNFGGYGHSNDEVRYSFKYNVAFEHAFFGDYKTRIDIFGETREGSPYSYTFQDTSGGRSSVFGTIGSNNRYLFYVPTGIDDPKVAYDNAATRDRIEAIVSGSDLSKYRGEIAPRNGFHSKWFTKMDIHVEQQIPTFIGDSRITLFGDIENFTNLLNHKWGQQLRANFPYSKVVTRVTCVASGSDPCAKYLYTTPSTDTQLADQLITANGSSLYAIRVGARFTF